MALDPNFIKLISQEELKSITRREIINFNIECGFVLHFYFEDNIFVCISVIENDVDDVERQSKHKSLCVMFQKMILPQ